MALVTVVVVFGGLVGMYFWAAARPGLLLTASVSVDSTGMWYVDARALRGGQLADSVRVWATAHDRTGASFAPVPVLTTGSGDARLGPIPKVIGPLDTVEINRITVRARVEQKRGARSERTVTLRLDGSPGYLRYSVSGSEFLLLGVLFLASVLIAFASVDKGPALETKYLIEVLLAFLLPAVLLSMIAGGHKHVSDIGEEIGAAEVSLGFAQMVKGSYMPQGPPEWILSLTSPTLRTGEDEVGEGVSVGTVAPGFGAPLWVILVSVTGSMLFTIALVIRSLEAPIGSLAVEEVQSRVRTIVLHQFFVLFSPLGAMFVYQFMLISGTASQPVTVALAAMAAGVGVNVFLKRAVAAMRAVVED